jgi:hypothetical protein
VAPWAVSEAWSLLAPDARPLVDPARWSQQARTLLAAEVTPVELEVDAGGELCSHARFVLDVAPLRAPARATQVQLVTLPLEAAPEVQAAARLGVAAIGGAGFDVLLERARRLWQVHTVPLSGPETRAPLVVAALLAFVLYAPLLPPGGGAIGGLKFARTRLEAQGWPD